MPEDQSESLAGMIRSYLDDDEVALLPNDIDAEVRRNTWRYSVAADSIVVADAVAALQHVATELRQRFADHAGTATFYAWYDEQAGQVRCSLRSRAPEDLPFGAAYRTTEDAADVVRLAATDSHPGHIPWSDLSDTTDPPDDSAAQAVEPFPVWCAVVTGGSTNGRRVGN
ncbi:hypothetical protein [Actinoplanes sp. NPDC049681]|uniref:hypothetical protein n=1 Tax=Actinoplanes sp. NPDC049681 TaxID=3363905 RepID=UPI0037999189